MSDVKISIAWHSIKYILTVVFMILNLTGIVHWHLLLIISPLLISLVLKVVAMILLGFLVCVVPRMGREVE